MSTADNNYEFIKDILTFMICSGFVCNDGDCQFNDYFLPTLPLDANRLVCSRRV